MADTVPNTPKSEIEKKLEAEANLAKHRKAIAEANEAEAKAEKQLIESKNAALESEKNTWKAPEVNAFEGKITSTGNFIETQLLANKCLSVLTGKLIEKIFRHEPFKTKDSNFVFYNAADFSNVELCISFLEHLKTLKAVLEEAIEQGKNSQKKDEADVIGGFAPIAVGFAAATGIVRTAADLFSLFKQNTTITNSDIPSEDTLIISAFANKLREKNQKCKVFYPAGYPVYMLESPDSNSSEFIKLFTIVQNAANQAFLLQQEIEKESAEIDTQLLTTTDLILKSKLENRKLKISYGLSRLQSATSTFSQSETTLLTIDPTTKLSMRALLLRAEKLVALLKEESTFIIKLSAKLNGSTRIKEGLFKMSKALHSGGAQLNCLIFSKDGSVLFSDNLSSYMPSQESSEITI